jgi:AcrR family transcriptional regulator
MQPRKQRGSIRRAAVIDAALHLVDREGMHRLTVRALANELETGAMSLYTHFARKEQLLDLMFERVLERMLDVAPEPTWERDLASACRHGRKVLLAHPHWYPLLTRVSVPPLSLRFYDRLIQRMRDDGFEAEEAMHAFSSVFGYMLGAVLVERLMSAHHQPPVPLQRLSLVRDMLPAMPAGRFPAVAAIAPSFAAWSFDRVFEVGIESLIAGLRSARAQGGGRRPRRRA